ncbi:putative esterase with patatin domain protein [Legionella gratiana]|uniref:Esterase with patatin domain protein n=1 Tax=Legionella gratiana TaxID=45066 RepID=A0A378JD91_9GAMM|nr:hypothetical protein [Legionella gratiana]KTD06495.1 putative esterase with patatin domain protein [Legionella gratiana]STX45316.1 putative esterase with patatin domain [Legionella gratiana]
MTKHNEMDDSVQLENGSNQEISDSLINNGIVAFLDIDDTVQFENGLNQALLDSLKNNGIRDIYFITDMLIQSSDIEHRLKIKEQIEQQGFRVHGFITPLDLAWINSENNVQRDEAGSLAKTFSKQLYLPQFGRKKLTGDAFDSILRDLNLSKQFPSYKEILEKPLNQMTMGSAFNEAVTVYQSDLSKGKVAKSGFQLSHDMNERGIVAKLLADQRSWRANYTHSKGLLLEAFMTNKPAWIKGIIMADDNAAVISSIEQYVERKAPAIPISTIHVNKNKINANEYDIAIKKLVQIELNRLENTLNEYLQKNEEDRIDKKEKNLFEKGTEILNNVKEIVRKEKLDSNNQSDLIQVLSSTNKALIERFEPEKSKKNAEDLANLSTRVSGKSSTAWKALGVSLLVVSCAVLVTAGVLAAIPTGGTSLLLSVLGGVGLAATIGVGAGAAATGAMGAAALYHGREKGLAKSVHFFKDALREMKAEPSPFAVDMISNGDNNILRDWCRVDAGPVNINGESIQKIIQEDKRLHDLPTSEELFSNTDELKAFFKNKLLKNIAEEQKESVANELMEIFHQGGVLNPVCSAAFRYMHELGYPPADARNIDEEDIPAQRREINFTLTEKGFKIQEIVTQNRVNSLENIEAAIKPDKGQSYVYKAQSTLNIDCSKLPLDIKVESNTILFGNKMIENLIKEKMESEKKSEVVPMI